VTETRAERRPGRILRRLNHLPAGLSACAVVLVVAVAVAAVTRGTPGVVGAVIGVVGVTASYVLSGLAVAWADSVSPQLTMPVGLATYVVKFSLLGAVLIAFSESDWPGIPPMAFAIIAAVLAWNAGHLWWIMHAKIPYVELDPHA
jgi:hypothetical protein